MVAPSFTRQARLLFVDPDEEFCSFIWRDYTEAGGGAGDTNPVPVFCDSLRDVQVRLVEPRCEYHAIFVNPSLGDPVWQAVLRAAHRYCPGVPLYLLSERGLRLRQSEADELGICGIFKKPLSYSKALSASMQVEGRTLEDEARVDARIEAVGTPEAARPRSHEHEAESQNLSEYMEVNLGAIAGAPRSHFDLYVQLSSGRLVRVLHAGDVLAAERIEGYRQRGLKALCIRKVDQEKYLSFCDGIISGIMKDDKAQVSVKLSNISKYGASTLSFLKSVGIEDATIDRAVRYVEQTAQVVEQIARSSEDVSRLIADVASLEHSVAVSTLAALFMRHIGGMNPALIATVGLAAFLHDVALVGESPEVQNESEVLMTPEQLIVYHAHPDVGARMLARAKGVPEMVISAVGDHHLRRRRGGFPVERATDEVNRLAELIGLCHDFLAAVQRSKVERGFDPVEYLSATAPKSFSEPVVDAFVRTFAAK
ncbi:MAG: HD domain-containing protein [Deltaproteobacteria bacterium]|nr:HD domain-containing protein [Deltaproteobacteria bacterium]